MRLLALATLALTLGAACGGNGDAGPTKAEYERQLQALPDLFAGDDCAVPDPVEALEARQAALAERVEALEALEPPSEVAEAHARYLSAHRARADALAEAMPEVRALRDPHEAKTRDEQAQLIAEGFALVEQAVPEPTALGAAQRAFVEAGYALEPPALEPDEYEERTNEVVAEISPIALADAQTMADLQADAERVGLELLEATERLEEIVPPPSVEEAHEHLVLGVCSRAQELLTFSRFGGVEPDEPADTAGLRAVIASLDPFFEEAAGDYRDRGFDVAVPEVEADA